MSKEDENQQIEPQASIPTTMEGVGSSLAIMFLKDYLLDGGTITFLH